LKESLHTYFTCSNGS